MTMALPKVGTKHPDYKKRLPQWTRQRDVIEGEDQVKAKGEAYLPRLDGQQSGLMEQFVGQDPNVMIVSYDSYKKRAQFMNATGRTRDGLVGAIMRKEPDLTWQKDDEVFLSHIGRGLESLGEIIHETLDENVGIGRLGHLVDIPAGGGDPYVATYYAENITNWTLGLINGREVPIHVDLCEYQEGSNSKGEPVQRERYRRLVLGTPGPATKDEYELVEGMGEGSFNELYGITEADMGRGAIYFQEIWDEIETDSGPKQFVRTALIIPRVLGGATLNEIPFQFFNAVNCKTKPQKPPMMDLTVVNLSHYKNSADLEHGLHFTALPQPWAAGFKFKTDVFIGSGVAWVSDEPRARCGYLEFSGQGLKAISDRMEEKKKEMATLGARLLESQTPAGAAEAMETVQLRQSGERSVLTRISIATSYGISRTLRFLAIFRGQSDSEKVGLKLNTDFGVSGLAPDQIMALMSQVQAGLISWNTYFWNLKRGEVIPDGVQEKDESIRIEAGPPNAPAGLLPDTGNKTLDTPPKE